MPSPALKCVPVVSRWVDQAVQMCDGTLTLLFKDGACCWYPNTNPWYFDLAITWGGPGEFVWKFLYRILPYRLIALPCPPAGCTTTTTVQSSLNPANAGDSIT